MNRHIFLSRIINIVLFLSVENNISFVQIFTWLILENQIPLKHNQGRLTETSTDTFPMWSPVNAFIEILPQNQRQSKVDWQARQSSAKEWQQGNRHKKHTLSSPQDSRNKKANPHDPYREHQHNQKHVISHQEYIVPEVTASEFSTLEQSGTSAWGWSSPSLYNVFLFIIMGSSYSI